MHVRIVTFRLDGMSHDEYVALATEVAPAFAAWPGLVRKVWLADRLTETYGGVYLFESSDDADASRATDLFKALAGNPHFTDLAVREIGTLQLAEAITA